MRNYTTIPNNICKELISADVYRLTCLSMTPRDEETRTYTDSTFKQIGAVINSKNPESENTVKDFVKRLKKSNIIKIEEGGLKDKVTGRISRRNRYYFPKYKENFRFVHKSLLELDLDIAIKGFMIQLSSLRINNTDQINYSINKISQLVKISRPTATKYIEKLIELDLLEKTDKGYRIDTRFFTTIGKSKKQLEIEAIYKEVSTTGFLFDRFQKTDWASIDNPSAYWLSVQAGIIGKQTDKKIENDVIMM